MHSLSDNWILPQQRMPAMQRCRLSIRPAVGRKQRFECEAFNLNGARDGPASPLKKKETLLVPDSTVFVLTLCQSGIVNKHGRSAKPILAALKIEMGHSHITASALAAKRKLVLAQKEISRAKHKAARQGSGVKLITKQFE
jgi:hypothetical protein